LQYTCNIKEEKMKKNLFRIFCVFVFTAFAGTSQAVIINFDDIPGATSVFSLTPVSNQYAGLGVTFSDPAGVVGAIKGATIEGTGYSSPNVLFAWQHQADDTGDLRISFTGGTRNVAFDAFLSTYYYLHVLAYGAQDVLISDHVFAIEEDYAQAQHDVITSDVPIQYLLLTSHPSTDPQYFTSGLPSYFGNFSIDNLSFDVASSDVPEPATGMLMATGLLALCARAKHRRQA
jgi:hypothetical protein